MRNCQGKVQRSLLWRLSCRASRLFFPSAQRWRRVCKPGRARRRWHRFGRHQKLMHALSRLVGQLTAVYVMRTGNLQLLHDPFR